MTTFYLLAVHGKTVPVAPPQALFRVELLSNSYRLEIPVASIETADQIFSSVKNPIIN